MVKAYDPVIKNPDYRDADGQFSGRRTFQVSILEDPE